MVISSRFSENLEEMFPRYYMLSDVCNRFRYYCDTKRVKECSLEASDWLSPILADNKYNIYENNFNPLETGDCADKFTAVVVLPVTRTHFFKMF